MRNTALPLPDPSPGQLKVAAQFPCPVPSSPGPPLPQDGVPSAAVGDVSAVGGGWGCRWGGGSCRWGAAGGFRSPGPLRAAPCRRSVLAPAGHSAPLPEPGPEAAGARGAGETGRAGGGGGRRAGGGARRARPGLRRGGGGIPSAVYSPRAQGRASAFVLGARGAAPLLAVGRRRRRRRQRLGTALRAPRASAAAAAAAPAEAPAVSAPRWCRLPRSFGASSLRSHHGRSGMASAGVAAACP